MKKQMLLLMVVMLFCTLFSSGCASIMLGGNKVVSVSSDPTGAHYSIARKGKIVKEGTTPDQVTLKRGGGYFKAASYTVTLKKAGYKTVEQPIEQGLEAGWYILGNIIFGGLIGIVIVDPITGAMYSIADVDVTLETEGAAMTLREDYRCKVLSIDQVPQSLRAKMVRIN